MSQSVISEAKLQQSDAVGFKVPHSETSRDRSTPIIEEAQTQISAPVTENNRKQHT